MNIVCCDLKSKSSSPKCFQMFDETLKKKIQIFCSSQKNLTEISEFLKEPIIVLNLLATPFV